MAKTRGAHAASPSTCNPRPRASLAWNSTYEAPQAPAIPLSEGGVHSNPLQHRQPMVTQPPIKEIWIVKPSHSTRAIDSFHLLQRYHLEHLMTLRDFFYPRVALDFYRL
ncbi:hypothetical protein AAG906_025092 [Vitis piasezkii]